MTNPNKAELRRLAEAMPDLDWDSQFEDHEQIGFCCVYAKPFELDGEMHDGPTFVERCYQEQAKFIAEAKENVLSLLDECELLRNGAKGDFDLDAWLEWAKEAQALRTQNAGLIAQHGRDSVELSKQCHARDVARKERDAALAELEALRIQVGTLTEWYSNALDVISEVSAAIPGVTYMDPPDGGDVSIPEQIRRMAKDAKRYLWLRTADWWSSPLCVVRDPKQQAKPGTDCPSRDRLDSAIDAAMSQEANHA